MPPHKTFSVTLHPIVTRTPLVLAPPTTAIATSWHVSLNAATRAAKQGARCGLWTEPTHVAVIRATREEHAVIVDAFIGCDVATRGGGYASTRSIFLSDPFADPGTTPTPPPPVPQHRPLPTGLRARLDALAAVLPDEHRATVDDLLAWARPKARIARADLLA